MPLTEQDILAAREQRRPPEAGILQTLFDTLFPQPTGGIPAIPFMPGTLGYSPASTRLGMLRDRFEALRQSPFWNDMSRPEQLATLRGENIPHSPELHQALRLSEMARRSGGLSAEQAIGKKTIPPHLRQYRLGYLSDILKGGKP